MSLDLAIGLLPLLLVVAADVVFFSLFPEAAPPGADRVQMIGRLAAVAAVAGLAIVPNQTVRTTVAALLLLVAFLAGMTIGMFYLPAVAAAAVAAGRRPTHSAGRSAD